MVIGHTIASTKQQIIILIHPILIVVLLHKSLSNIIVTNSNSRLTLTIISNRQLYILKKVMYNILRGKISLPLYLLNRVDSVAAQTY